MWLSTIFLERLISLFSDVRQLLPNWRITDVSPQTAFRTLILGYHVTAPLASVELLARLGEEMQILATAGHAVTPELQGREEMVTLSAPTAHSSLPLVV